MAHKVVALGFGSCERLRAHVTEELSEYFGEEVAGFSYREALTDSKRFHRTINGADVITDSAGFTNLNGTKPERILGVSAPIPVFLPRLIGKACRSGIELMKPVKGEASEYTDLKRRCGENLVAEVGRHPRANMGRLGLIASFDAVAAAIAAKEAGIDAELLYRWQDRLFRLTEKHHEDARNAGLVITTINGRHEDFACEPAKTMVEYEAARELIVV